MRAPLTMKVIESGAALVEFVTDPAALNLLQHALSITVAVAAAASD